MEELRWFTDRSKKYIDSFFKWLVAGLIIGAVGGLAGTAFHYCVLWAGDVRTAHPWLIWLLPLGGAAIAGLYHLSRVRLDTNTVIRAIHADTEVSWLMAPLIFVSTVITHLFGGSVGREGAALQIGGSIGYQYGRLCRFDDKDRHLVVMCGMSAVFSAVFGTPITAVFFALEVTSVGIIYYAGLLPCITASFLAFCIARALGVRGMVFSLTVIPGFTVGNVLRTLALAILCALLSIVFCVCLHRGEKLARHFIKSDYLRIAAGGAAVAVMTWLVGTTDYNGAGMGVIAAAVAGSARPEDFILKLVFTVLSVCVGYKGGEIVPTMFVGATFGCVMGRLLGLDPGFAAALGFVALFCAMVNCPVTSILLSIELFGAAGLPFFVIACAVSYMMSGSYSLYLEQSVVYSKIKAQYVNRHTR